MPTVIMLCSLGVGSCVQFRGSFLTTERRFFPQHCDVTHDKSVLHALYMASSPLQTN